MIIGIDAEVLSYNRTGIGEYIYQIIKRLNKLDNKNEYILYSNNELKIDFELNKNWRIVIYKCKHLATWRYFNLPKLLKKDGVNVFWGPRFYLPRKCKNVKYISTIHDLITEKFPETRQSKKEIIMHKFFMKSVCKNAKTIIVISESTKKDLLKFYNLKNQKIIVTYLGIDKTEKKEIEQDLKKNIQEKFKILDRNEIYIFHKYNRTKKEC